MANWFVQPQASRSCRREHLFATRSSTILKKGLQVDGFTLIELLVVIAIIAYWQPFCSRSLPKRGRKRVPLPARAT